jgi:hypothetical protein
MENLQFTVRVDAPDGDPEELDEQTRRLLVELRDQPVESAELVRGGPLPAGAKGLDPSTVEIAVIVGSASIKLVLDLLSRRRGVVRFEGRVGGRNLKFEGAAKEFARMLATIGDSTKN